MIWLDQIVIPLLQPAQKLPLELEKARTHIKTALLIVYNSQKQRSQPKGKHKCKWFEQKRIVTSFHFKIHFSLTQTKNPFDIDLKLPDLVSHSSHATLGLEGGNFSVTSDETLPLKMWCSLFFCTHVQYSYPRWFFPYCWFRSRLNLFPFAWIISSSGCVKSWENSLLCCDIWARPEIK